MKIRLFTRCCPKALMLAVVVWWCLGNVKQSLAVPITLQNATATFSQTSFDVSETIDGNLGGTNVTNGWAINPQIVNQTAVYETSSDIGGSGGAMFTFTLTQNFGGTHTLGKFRLSATTDDRSLFADGLQSSGDVTANWITLDPLSAIATGGATLTIQGDDSILASGTSPAASVYTITAQTSLTGITGLRLEVIEDASLPSLGPGRQPSNGNFVLQEFQVDAVALFIPEPASIYLLGFGMLALSRRRRSA
jgi:hypothetical protein